MSDSSTTSSFQCPDGYEAENISSQLHYEDLDDDSELWLIRMPHDLNPSEIENSEIILDENYHVLNNDGETEYEYISDVTAIPNFTLILPQRDNGKLRNVKRVMKGSIFFNEAISMNNLDIVKMEVYDSVTNSVPSTCENNSSDFLNNDSLLSSQGKKTKNRKKSKKSIDAQVKKEFMSD